MTRIGVRRTFADMDRSDALGLIPAQYGVALRMSTRGATKAEIAAALGIEAEAVGPLLTVAEAKLQRVLVDNGGPERSAYGPGTG